MEFYYVVFFLRLYQYKIYRKVFCFKYIENIT